MYIYTTKHNSIMSYVNVGNVNKSVKNFYVKIDDNTWKPVYYYEWEPEPWQACSVSCGGGVQYRNVKCYRYPNKLLMEDKFCSDIVKPNTSQSCNTQPCYPTSNSFTYGSKRCGGTYTYMMYTGLNTTETVTKNIYCTVEYMKTRRDYGYNIANTIYMTIQGRSGQQTLTCIDAFRYLCECRKYNYWDSSYIVLGSQFVGSSSECKPSLFGYSNNDNLIRTSTNSSPNPYFSSTLTGTTYPTQQGYNCNSNPCCALGSGWAGRICDGDSSNGYWSYAKIDNIWLTTLTLNPGPVYIVWTAYGCADWHDQNLSIRFSNFHFG